MPTPRPSGTGPVPSPRSGRHLCLKLFPPSPQSAAPPAVTMVTDCHVPTPPDPAPGPCQRVSWGHESPRDCTGTLRNRSFITRRGRGGGAKKLGNGGSETVCIPSPQDSVKMFVTTPPPSLSKVGNFVPPPP